MATTRTQAVKDERLVARICPEDKAVIERAAALAGQSVASFVVAHAREAAVQTVAEHERIQLNERDSRGFVEALLAPARKAPAAVKKAAKAYKDSVTDR